MADIAFILASDVYRGAILTLGVIVAVASVVSAKNTARKKQTADAIFASRTDSELQKGLRLVAAIHESDNRNIGAMSARDKQDSDEAKLIRYVLNHYEYVAIGIRNGIYDEQMFKDASYSTIISLHTRASPFIEGVRTVSRRQTVYQELRCMVQRWEESPLEVRKKWK
jgi:hypothetical protein